MPFPERQPPAGSAKIGPLADAVDRLTRAGYTESFRVEGSMLRSIPAGVEHDPAAMQIDEVCRFEGPTDPADEAVVFALTCRRSGLKGTYVAAYGARADPADARVICQLEEARRAQTQS